MYSDVFCKVYNEFGWNYYPEAFAGQLLLWLRQKGISPKSSLDLACGTGVLCRLLQDAGIRARGMDFSQGMIDIARETDPRIPYDVADMTLYRPDERFDLVTCTGDSLNHIPDLRDLEQVFRNVYGYLAEDGWFIFDLLDEKEVSSDEPFDLEFSDTIRAQFQMLRCPGGRINLKTKVWENGEFRFEENIWETLHDPEVICRMLREVGFRSVRRSHNLRDDAPGQSVTWYILAQK